MNVSVNSKKLMAGLIIASAMVFNGCLTEEDDDGGSTSDPVTTKDAALGAQNNTGAGSFLDADDMSVTTCPSEANCPAKAVAAKVDLVFAYSGSASAAAIYSPVVARDGLTAGTGFSFVTTALGTSARSTTIKNISKAQFDAATTVAGLDSAYNAAGAQADGRVLVATDGAFAIKTDAGKTVGFLVTALEQGAAGTVTLKGKAKF